MSTLALDKNQAGLNGSAFDSSYEIYDYQTQTDGDPNLEEQENLGFKNTDFNITDVKLTAIRALPDLENSIKILRFQNTGTSTPGEIAMADASGVVGIDADGLAHESEEEQAGAVAYAALRMDEDEDQLDGPLSEIARKAVANDRIRTAGLEVDFREVDIPNAMVLGAKAIYEILVNAKYFIENPAPIRQQGFYDEPEGNYVDGRILDFTPEQALAACYGNHKLWNELVAWVEYRKAQTSEIHPIEQEKNQFDPELEDLQENDPYAQGQESDNCYDYDDAA